MSGDGIACTARCFLEPLGSSVCCGIVRNLGALAEASAANRATNSDAKSPMILNATFESLGISPPLLASLRKQGIENPTPIQMTAIPRILSATDLFVHAETGSGKTLAFLLPLLSSVDTSAADIQVVVLAPTHELALQIHRVCTDTAQLATLSVRALLLIGGTSKERQLEKLRKKPHIIVGTPGRVAELVEMRKLKLHKVKSLVIDEADTLLLSENLAEVRRILKALPRERQLIFVSASRSKGADELIREISDRVEVAEGSRTAIAPSIAHYYLFCEERDKPDLVRSALHSFDAQRAIIFVHRNETAEIIAAKLAHHKFPAVDLHGAREKQARQSAMEQFRTGKIRALIASDVAARGLDIQDVSHVINLDPPTESKAYLHRVGRTGRAGKKGIALTLLTESQRRLVRRFESELSISMQQVRLRHGNVEQIAAATE